MSVPLKNLRIVPREEEFLNRKSGLKGEIFFNEDTGSLRLYNGAPGGKELALADFSNVATANFTNKTVESQLATVIYNVTITSPQVLDTGNKYVLNGVYKAQPNFVVGYIYVFNQDDPTNVYFPNANGTTVNPHPINFSADNLSGERGGGTSYLVNVRYLLDGATVTQSVYNSAAFITAAARQVQITITNATPATLYYWCWNHPAMGNAIAVADPGSGSSGGGNVTVSVSPAVPSTPTNGNLWLNTNNGSLYVYISDGDSSQWMQPAVPIPQLPNIAFFVAADDSTKQSVPLGDTIQFIGAGGIVTTSTDDGVVIIENTGTASTGNITFAGTTLDSADSSGITFTPAVTFNSDVAVENDLVVRNVVSASKFESTAVGVPELLSETNLNLSAVNAVVITRSPLRLAQFTVAQRDQISAQNGDLIYNTTANKLQGYENGGWVNLI